MNVISEIKIPKILASKYFGNEYPKGNSFFDKIKLIVVVPPKSILQKAAFGLLLCQNKAQITGTNKPETINAYEYSISSNTFCICEANKMANKPTLNVTI